MARKGLPKVKSQGDLLATVVSGLRTTAQRPTIFGYEPMEKQEIFHSTSAKGRLFLGGNRSGKTVGGATEAVMWCMGNHRYFKTPPPPVRGRCVAVDFLEGVEKIVKPEVARWVPPSALMGGSWESAYDKELKTLYFQNGSFLEFMSYEQDTEKFAGTSRHFVWFDEEPPKEIFQECGARLIDTGGYWWMTMTPVDGMGWTYDDIFIPARTNPNLFVIQVAMDENVHLNPGEIDAYFAGMDAQTKEARRLGKYVAMGGLIYKMFSNDNLIDSMIKTPFWPWVQKNWLHFRMMDHGFNNPTAWLWGAVDRDDRMVVYDEWYKSGLVVAEHAEIVLDKTRLLGITPRYSVGDPSIAQTDGISGINVQTEYANNGIIIIPGNNSVETGINLVAKALGIKRLFITRNCENLLRELPKYRWARWASSKMRDDRNAKEQPHKKDDHACDALRYGVASRPKMYDMLGPEDRSKSPVEGIPSSTKDELVDAGVRKLPNRHEDKTDANFELGDEW